MASKPPHVQDNSVAERRLRPIYGKYWLVWAPYVLDYIKNANGIVKYVKIVISI